MAEARRRPHRHALKIIVLFLAVSSVGVFILSPEWTRSLTHLRPTQPTVDLSSPHKHPPQSSIDDSSNEAAEDSAEDPTKQSAPSKASDLSKDVTHLSKLCYRTEWTEGLWLSCHSNCGADGESICGGLNNARNRLQSCVRLAIDAGAGIIFPTMSLRNEKTLQPHAGTEQLCARNLWNTEQLAANLKIQCPQLNVRFCGNSTGLGPKLKSQGIRHFNDPPHTIGTFRATVDTDLANNNITDISASKPVRVDFYDGMFSWNYTASNELETIRKDLFKLLPYNPEILSLGVEIFNLVNRFAPFVGIHLRGEGDWPPFFGTKEQQMDAYKKDLQKLQKTADVKVSNLYVSCGDQTSIEVFRQKMKPLNYTVHDKWTLLADAPVLLAKMENLTFDQKGIVEYKTLTAADYFFGVGLSSMSLLVAFDRTVDEEKDFFSQYVHNNSTRVSALNREYQVSPEMKGHDKTRLFMLSGPDIMDRYP